MLRSSFLSISIKRIITGSAVRQCNSHSKNQNPKNKWHNYDETEGHYISSPFEPVEIPKLQIHEYVWQNLPKYENYIAVVSIINNTIPK